MRDIILACIGIVIAAAGGVYLARLLYYKRFGVTVKAEVTDVNEVIKRKGIVLESIAFKSSRVDNYVHIMKYDIGGKTYEVRDKAGYTQPLKVGSTHLILCDPKEPEKFKGSIVHITNMLRIALTGRANAPDIHEVSHVLGEDIVRARLSKWA